MVLQAADLLLTRKLVPNLPTWLQCFTLFAAAVTQEKPERMAKLMAYQTTIAKASQRYKWPLWVIYDASFKQELAGVSGSHRHVWTPAFTHCVLRDKQLEQRTGVACARHLTILCRFAQSSRGSGHGVQRLQASRQAQAVRRRAGDLIEEVKADSAESVGTGTAARHVEALTQ